MNAGEVMTAAVITAAPDSTVAELARLMLQHRISGVPVIDAGQLVGIVSEGDLVRRLTPAAPRGLLAALFARHAGVHEYLHAHGLLARDVMTPDVVTVRPETEVGDVAALMERNGIKRVPVLDEDGALVGIVTRANLLRALTTPAPAVEMTDQAIRQNLVALLAETGWAGAPNPQGVRVGGGIAHLWGPVASEALRRALVAAASAAPGVRGVVDHMSVAE